MLRLISLKPKSSSAWWSTWEPQCLKFQRSHPVSEAFSLWRCCNHHFFTSKVPVGSQVEGHVGEHHQILTESEECINYHNKDIREQRFRWTKLDKWLSALWNTTEHFWRISCLFFHNGSEWGLGLSSSKRSVLYNNHNFGFLKSGCRN